MKSHGFPQRVRTAAQRAWRFVNEDVWDIDLASLSGGRSVGVRAVRVIYLVLKGFHKDECPMYASALTFNTLMAIVPILALSLALARGFGNVEVAKQRIRGVVSEWTQTFNYPGARTNAFSGALSSGGQPGGRLPASGEDEHPSDLAADIDRMVEAAFKKVENISFAALGGAGLVVLLWLVVAVLGRVENSFNRVWGVSQGRSLWRKGADYLSAILIVPFLVVLASSLPVADFATRFLDETTANVVRAFLRSWALKHLTVIGMTTLCFAFVIAFMPNTKVRVLPALSGGLVAALLFIAWLWICAAIQVGAARYGKIYGSFATVPILLAWVFVSWEIVLFGAEVAFAVQNYSTYRMEQGSRKASVESRVLLGLALVVEAARAMHQGTEHGFDAAAYASRKRVPVRFLNDVVEELVSVGLLGELSGQRGRFVLLKAPGDLTTGDVFGALARTGTEPEALGLDRVNLRVSNVMDQAAACLRERVGQKTVESLLDQTAPPA